MIITLTGANHYLIKQTVDALAAEFESKHGAFGVERVSGEDADVGRLADLMQGASLFAAERLVVLSDASLNKPLWERLGKQLEHVPAQTTLVLVEPTLDKRTKTYKALRAGSDFREFAEPGEGELIRWAASYAKELGGQLEVPVARQLVERVGTDQWRLANELDKLVQFAPQISVAALDALVESTPQASAFELLDAVLARQPQRAQELLARLQLNEDPYRFLGLLISQVHALAVVQAAGQTPADAIASAAGLHPFVVRKSQSLARKLTATHVATMADAVAQCDHQLKSTGIDPWVLVRQCVGKLAV